MVDQPHSPGTPGGGERPPAGPGWIGRAILGALGITALLNLLLGRRDTDHSRLPVPADQTRPSDALFRPLPDEVVHGDGRIEHPNVSYERTDASLPWIVGLLLLAVLLAAGVHGSMWWLLKDYKRYEARIKKPDFPLVSGPSNPLPPRPRLEQVDRETDKNDPRNIPDTDLMVIESAKLHLLNSFGDTHEHGFAHIPIADAMHLLGTQPDKYNAPYRKRLPAGIEKVEKWQRGLVDAGESNSGRMPRPEARWFEH